MGPVLLLVAVAMLYSCEAEGTSTGTVFVQTGKDLLLDVKEHVALEEGSDLIWKLNGSRNIARLFHDNKITIFKSYKGRAEVSVQNYSLLLKNVQKDDSGSYTAQFTGDEDRDVAQYQVTVQDPVSPVKLTVNSRSSDSCNFTVICSTVDSHISSTFRCDNQTCFQEGGGRSEATTSPSINVYVEQGFIICNHSNRVSWEQDKNDIKSVCGPPPVPSGAIAIGAGVGIAVLAGLIGLFLVIKYKKKNNGNTIYAVPQNIDPAQTPNQNPTEDASGQSPTSTYCVVQFHTGPEGSTKTKHTPLPETVYAQVNRSGKTKCRSPP